MAKATHASGPTFTDDELNDPDPVVIKRAEIGYVDRPEIEEEESTSPDNQEDGTDSSPSSKKEHSPTERSTHSAPKAAPTTESHSNPQETDQGSTVHSTDGDGPKTPRKPSSSRTPAKKANPRAARVRTTDDEFDDEF